MTNPTSRGQDKARIPLHEHQSPLGTSHGNLIVRSSSPPGAMMDRTASMLDIDGARSREKRGVVLDYHDECGRLAEMWLA